MQFAALSLLLATARCCIRTQLICSVVGAAVPLGCAFADADRLASCSCSTAVCHCAAPSSVGSRDRHFRDWLQVCLLYEPSHPCSVLRLPARRAPTALPAVAMPCCLRVQPSCCILQGACYAACTLATTLSHPALHATLRASRILCLALLCARQPHTCGFLGVPSTARAAPSSVGGFVALP